MLSLLSISLNLNRAPFLTSLLLAQAALADMPPQCQNLDIIKSLSIYHAGRGDPDAAWDKFSGLTLAGVPASAAALESRYKASQVAILQSQAKALRDQSGEVIAAAAAKSHQVWQHAWSTDAKESRRAQAISECLKLKALEQVKPRHGRAAPLASVPNPKNPPKLIELNGRHFDIANMDYGSMSPELRSHLGNEKQARTVVDQVIQRLESGRSIDRAFLKDLVGAEHPRWLQSRAAPGTTLDALDVDKLRSTVDSQPVGSRLHADALARLSLDRKHVFSVLREIRAISPSSLVGPGITAAGAKEVGKKVATGIAAASLGAVSATAAVAGYVSDATEAGTCSDDTAANVIPELELGSADLVNRQVTGAGCQIVPEINENVSAFFALSDELKLKAMKNPGVCEFYTRLHQKVMSSIPALTKVSCSKPARGPGAQLEIHARESRGSDLVYQLQLGEEKINKLCLSEPYQLDTCVMFSRNGEVQEYQIKRLGSAEYTPIDPKSAREPSRALVALVNQRFGELRMMHDRLQETADCCIGATASSAKNCSVESASQTLKKSSLAPY